MSRRPIPSSGFCYDSNQCREWYDKWLRRGGTIARDTVYVRRAADMPDLRSFEFQVKWARIEGDLRVRRAQLRQTELMQEIDRIRQRKKDLRVVK